MSFLYSPITVVPKKLGRGCGFLSRFRKNSPVSFREAVLAGKAGSFSRALFARKSDFRSPDNWMSDKAVRKLEVMTP